MGTHTVYIGLGSNEGNRPSNLAEAVRRIGKIQGTEILAVSPLYETSPVEAAGGFFLNMVAAIKTDRDPHALMEAFQRIESDMGRTGIAHRGEPRKIDIDILLYGEKVVTETGLDIPHPRMVGRRFVLEPLADLAPDLRIPNEEKTVSQMASSLRERHPEQVVKQVGRLRESCRKKY